MIEALTDPFSQGIGLRALLDLILLGAVCAPFGVWVVLYGQSYAAESIAHSMLPGLAAAAVIGAPLGLGAAAGLALAAGLIALAGRLRTISPDIAIAVTVTGLFGLGALIALSAETPVRLGEILFGDPLSVSGGDLAASAALASALAAAMAAGHRRLAVVAFDAQSARSLGASAPAAALLVIGLLALTTLIAVQALGNLLVVAIVVAPAAAALQLCHRLPPALLCAAALGMASGVTGLYLSFYADLAAGASVALCAVGTYACALAFRGRRLPGWATRRESLT